MCEWSVLKAFIQSTYYIGQMGGSLVFGFLGDRYFSILICKLSNLSYHFSLNPSVIKNFKL